MLYHVGLRGRASKLTKQYAGPLANLLITATNQCKQLYVKTKVTSLNKVRLVTRRFALHSSDIFCSDTRRAGNQVSLSADDENRKHIKIYSLNDEVL